MPSSRRDTVDDGEKTRRNNKNSASKIADPILKFDQGEPPAHDNTTKRPSYIRRSSGQCGFSSWAGVDTSRVIALEFHYI